MGPKSGEGKFRAICAGLFQKIFQLLQFVLKIDFTYSTQLGLPPIGKPLATFFVCLFQLLSQSSSKYAGLL